MLLERHILFIKYIFLFHFLKVCILDGVILLWLLLLTSVCTWLRTCLLTACLAVHLL